MMDFPFPSLAAAGEAGAQASGEVVAHSPLVPVDRAVSIGGYNIRLELNPRPVALNQVTRVIIHVSSPQRSSSPDDLLVVLRLRDEATGVVTNPTRPARFSQFERAFTTTVVFSKPGRHSLHVGVWEVGTQPQAVGFLLEVPEKTVATASAEARAGTAPPPSASSPRPEQSSDLRQQVSFETTEAGLLRINWLQKEPAPERVVFALIDGGGEEFARQTDGTDPFYGLFKNYNQCAKVKIEVHYSNGVSADLVIPFSEELVGKR